MIFRTGKATRLLIAIYALCLLILSGCHSSKGFIEKQIGRDISKQAGPPRTP